MSEFEKEMWWAGIFAIGKGITYLLFMAAMIKYLWSWRMSDTFAP